MTAPRKEHHNNFGVLRLMLAYAVIVSHSPEMLDGNPLREPLRMLGSQETFGGLAVDGFFIISGYLIASSYLSSRSLVKFLSSRIFRIYPAFLVASLICIFLVGPMAGGSLDAMGTWGWLSAFGKMLSLASPEMHGAFQSLPIPALDGSMWTIRYEFRCYVLVALLGLSGLLSKRILILSMTVALYVVALFAGALYIPRGHLHQLVFGLVGDPAYAFALTAMFMSGVCARLYRDQLRYRPVFLALSFLICVGAILRLRLPFPEWAVGTVGTYFLLWAALGLNSQFLRQINNSYDFSYGAYLYAWPIASLIMLVAQDHHTDLPPVVLTGLTIVFATLAGAVSWYAIERPTLGVKLRRSIVIDEAAIP
jgi:peptidoglycan/LPS O-acetylase OafA/YrhL